MNNNLLDSTKKAGMHIFYTYLLSHVCRIAGAASQRSNSQASVGGKIPFGPQHLQYNIAEKNSNHFIFILFFLLCIGILTLFF